MKSLAVSVSVILLCVSSQGCDVAFGMHLPRHVRVDSRFTSQEIQDINDAAEEWNKLSQECLGTDAIIVDGLQELSEFVPERDLNDFSGTIFLGKKDDFYLTLKSSGAINSETVKDTIIGITSESDIVLFEFMTHHSCREMTDTYFSQQRCAEIYPEISWWSESEFRHIAAHEMGHFIGMFGHVDSEPALLNTFPVRNTGPDGTQVFFTTPQRIDRELFKATFGCSKSQ